MDRYADGDTQAFGEVYDHLAPRLHTFLQRQTRDAAAADDLVQQTFLQIHHARATYLRGADVLPWAFAIARRLVIDRHRRRRPELSFDRADGAHGEDAEDWLASREGNEAGPDALLEAKQTAARVAAVLDGLPEGQRLAFELLKRDGLSLIEAAEILGIGVGAVKVRAHRAYEAIRAVLQEGPGSDARTPRPTEARGTP